MALNENKHGCVFDFREFVKNAWADIERFKEQKNRDLKEALISYAVMQISMCKKVASPREDAAMAAASAGSGVHAC